MRRTVACLLLCGMACGGSRGSGGAGADVGGDLVEVGGDTTDVRHVDTRDVPDPSDTPDTPDTPDGSDTADVRDVDVPPSQPCEGAETDGHTVGLISCEPGVEPGYVLFGPNAASRTWLIDRAGRVVHKWEHDARPALAVYLLDDGRLLRTFNTGQGPFRAGGAGGGLELVEWDGEVSWSWRFVGDEARLHHDVAPMPGGSVMVIAWEYKSAQQAIDAGRDRDAIPDEGAMWAEQILEIRPRGSSEAEVVWSWHVWDHLVQDRDPDKPNFGNPSEHPDRVDVNFAGRTADWLHINSVFYRPDLDQVLLSVHNFSEVWVVDRGTGSLVYRWGNPLAYGRGTSRDQQLFLQHDARWIPADRPGGGNLMVFNNGTRARGFSTVDEIVPPLRDDGSYDTGEGAHGPGSAIWTYAADDFYSSNISGAERLPGGNTLVCEGAEGRFFEITPVGSVVWEYRNPDHGTDITEQGEVPPPSRMGGGLATATFRARHIPVDHPALAGRDLTPGAVIER